MFCKNLLFLVFSFLPYVVFSQLDIVNSNIGIGTTSPDAKFHLSEGDANLRIKDSSYEPNNINKTVDITAGSDGSIRVGAIKLSQNMFNGAAFQAFSNANTIFPGQFYFDAGTNAQSGLFFRTSQQPRMVIVQNGNVGIGTNAPVVPLHVAGSVQATSFDTPSDEQLKSDIRPFSAGLAAVLQLNPMSYQYNGKGGTRKGSTKIGLMAQDLQKVVPELVSEYTYVEKSNATLDKAGVVLSTDNFLSIKDNQIKYLLLNAIKEQQQLIETLQKEIGLLKAKIK